MKFSIWIVLYVTAVCAAALGMQRPWSFVAATALLLFWGLVFICLSENVIRSFLLKAVLGLWDLILDDIKSVWDVAGIILVAMVVGLAVLGLTLLNENSVRASRSFTCKNNLRQIAIALRAYDEANGCLPPAYIADKNGEPIHSWRTLLLPYLDRPDIYDAYDFNEPWDGPNNRQFSKLYLHIFKCDEHNHADGLTSTMVVVGPGTLFPGEATKGLHDISDGAGNTLLVMESTSKAVPWTQPVDLSMKEAMEILTAESLAGHPYGHGEHDDPLYVNSAFADGATRTLLRMEADDAKAILSIAGGEKVAANKLRFLNRYQPIARARLLSTLAFIVLALLPIPWCWRKKPKAEEHLKTA